jgi:hypothetical protein
MKRKDYERASKILEELTAGMVAIQIGPPERPDMAALLTMMGRLKRIIKPPLLIEDILYKVPGETHTARAREIGVSRQGYYNLLGGTPPNAITLKRLAELTGYPAEAIKEAW